MVAIIAAKTENYSFLFSICLYIYIFCLALKAKLQILCMWYLHYLVKHTEILIIYYRFNLYKSIFHLNLKIYRVVVIFQFMLVISTSLEFMVQIFFNVFYYLQNYESSFLQFFVISYYLEVDLLLIGGIYMAYTSYKRNLPEDQVQARL